MRHQVRNFLLMQDVVLCLFNELVNIVWNSILRIGLCPRDRHFVWQNVVPWN
jgi:hypothetical protein